MKKIIYIAVLTLLTAGCGTAARQPQDETVDIGYGTQEKGKLTNSVSSLKADRNKPQTFNTIYDYIRGRVAGVTVSPDNKITIRGTNSINSSVDPLFIVDGVEVPDISTINPSDVKSIDVIKDGSSAIYGMRGANGVIIITTWKRQND